MQQQDTIKELFGELDDDLLDLLNRTAECIRNFGVESASIKFDDGPAAKLKIKDGAVVISRVDKKRTSAQHLREGKRMVTIDIRNAGEELQRSFCAEKRREFWEILDAALEEADCKNVCPAEFREWLDITDFFTAPASTKFHDDFPGGLVAHSIAVYHELTKIATMHCNQYLITDSILRKQVAVAALLHDVCEIDCYHATNKDGGAKYTYSDPLPLGHGEKSVMLLQHGFKLTEVEMLAIRWHMGAYRDRDTRELDTAQRIPLVLHLHLADMMASRGEERQCGTN